MKADIGKLKIAACAAAGVAVLATVPAQAATARSAAAQSASVTLGEAHAQAAGSGGTVYRSCATKGVGASGEAEIHGWTQAGAKINVKLSLMDGDADGHYAAIRFVVQGLDGSWKYSRWNTVSGRGKYKEGWGKVEYSKGIDKAGVEVAEFKGKKMVESCMDVR
ncbi:hypothetical protein ACH4UR_21645 [Streptomyces lydicus]|uniref:hypothetical protein n=1 Tax=Streptomyces lydicus TaxID=47763 RepID=UPI0033F17F68